MVDIGSIVGTLMSGLIQARRMSDEQTAALAEYYRSNPLLEGLSVPRIRIPELIVDIPMLIDNFVSGEGGKMEGTSTIAAEAETQLKDTLAKHKIKMKSTFYKAFKKEIIDQLEGLKSTDSPVMKESVARSVQNAFTNALIKSKTSLKTTDQETISKFLRDKIPSVSISKEPIASAILATINTADVKDKASNANVVRLKITLKEEGLEWATQTNESGGIIRTLQPE